MANTAMDRRYSLMRQQVAETEGQARQQEVEALRRRFASMGAQNSGAALKTEQNVNRAGAQRLQQAYGQLDINRLGEEQAMEEAQKQRDWGSTEAEKGRTFATGERLGGQAFMSGEAEKGRSFATSERLGGQTFMSGEAEKQRGFATSERERGQEFLAGENVLQRQYGTREREASQIFSSAQVDKQLAAQLSNLLKQITAQKDMFNKEYDLNKEIAYFNMYGKGGKPNEGMKNMFDDINKAIMGSGGPGANMASYPSINYSPM